MLRFAAQLLVTDHCQYRAQPLVVGNRSLVDLLDFIEGPIGEFDAVVTDRQPAVGVVHDGHPLTDRRFCLIAWLKDEEHLVILQGQRPRQGTLLLPGKGIVEIVAGAHRPVRILAIRRRLGKARIVVSDECREQGVALGQSAAPASRNSLTSRSCKVLCARSTRPLAGLELAQMMSMLSVCNARPNWVMPSPPSAPGWLTRNTPCLSL